MANLTDTPKRIIEGNLTEEQKKLFKVKELLAEIPFDLLVIRFFDSNSTKMLDEKIQVLTDLKNGKNPINIPNYYKVLENYPPKSVLWD